MRRGTAQHRSSVEWGISGECYFSRILKLKRVDSRSECRKEGQGYRGAQREQQDHWHGSTSSSAEHRVGTLQPFSTIITEPGKRHHLDIGETAGNRI